MTVTEPRTDRPAMDDPTTAALFRDMRKAGITVACVGALLTALLVWVVLTAQDRGKAAVPMIVVLVASGVLAALSVWLWIRWLRPGGRLLRAQAWRPIPANVARVGRRWWNSDLRLDDGAVLRVARLSAAHHALIARTGRVWVVGPDESGWASMRVDGSRLAFPARRIRRAAGSEPAVAGDVTALMAAYLRARSLVPLWALGCMAAITAGWIALGGSWGVLGGLTVGIVATFGSRDKLLDRHLPAFVAGAEWTQSKVTLKPWGVGQGGHTDAAGRVWFGDGTSSPLSMPNASLDLLAAAHDAETLWFSQTPEPGKTLAVGFPGYPLLAVAKVSSVRT